MQLDDSDIALCKHPRLGSRFAVALVCTILLLPLVLALLALGAVTLILFWIVFLLWLLGEVTYARLVDNLVRVSDLNYPRIHQLAEEVRTALGVRKDISIFVYEDGSFNAGMIRIFRRRAIFIQSELLQSGVTDNEVRWIIGRFVGYLRLKQDRGIIDKLISITERSGIFTLLILPFRRAMVYSGDRLGLAAIGGDTGSAISAMQKLFVGRELGYSVNPLGIIAQRRETKGSIYAFLARIGSAFPSTTARYVDLLAFSRRAYPEQFAKFETETPGIPLDLDQLSGEYTDSSSVLTAIGLAALVAVVSAGFIWSLFGLPIISALGYSLFPQVEEAMPLDDAALSEEPAALDDSMAADAAAAVEAAANAAAAEAEAPAAIASYNFCIDNNTDFAVNYDTALYPGAGWNSFKIEPGQSQVHMFLGSDDPQMRLDVTLDSSVRTEQYSLTPRASYTGNDCAGAYYPLVTDGTTIIVQDGY